MIPIFLYIKKTQEEGNQKKKNTQACFCSFLFFRNETCTAFGVYDVCVCVLYRRVYYLYLIAWLGLPFSQSSSRSV